MKELRFIVLLGLFAVLPAVTCLGGQTNAGQENSPSSPVTQSVTFSGPADSQTEPASTQIVEYAPPPAEYARAKAYSNTRYRHIFIGALYGFLVLLVILRWRVASSFRDLAERVSPRRSLQFIVFAPLILLTIAILTLPSDIWDEALDRAYGLSVQTWPAWTRDWILNQAIMLIVGTLLVAVLYFVIRRSPGAGGSISGSLPFPSCSPSSFSSRWS